MLIMRINPERLKNGVTRRGQPLYVRPEAFPAPAERLIPAEKPATPPAGPSDDKTSGGEMPAARPPRNQGRLPRLDELDLPVLTEEDLQNWGRASRGNTRERNEPC